MVELEDECARECSECGNPLVETSASGVCGSCDSKGEISEGWSLPVTVVTGLLPVFIVIPLGYLFEADTYLEGPWLQIGFVALVVMPFYFLLWSSLYLESTGREGIGKFVMLVSLMILINVAIVIGGCAVI